MNTLILGGARSGKSRFAEQLAMKHQNVHYLATAVAVDEEIRQRILIHQSQRPAHWKTTEATVQLADTLMSIDADAAYILIDCLTFWVNNCLYKSTATWENEKQKFIRCLSDFKGTLIMVSNEAGMGVTPMGAQTRQFIDELGWLHQELAKTSQTDGMDTASIDSASKVP